MNRILIVEDGEELRARLKAIASQQGETMAVEWASEAKREIARTEFDVLVVDMGLEETDSGLEVLAAARRKDPLAQVILYSVKMTPSLSKQSMEEGAFDVIHRSSPFIDWNSMIASKIALALRFRHALQAQLQTTH